MSYPLSYTAHDRPSLTTIGIRCRWFGMSEEMTNNHAVVLKPSVQYLRWFREKPNGIVSVVPPRTLTELASIFVYRIMELFLSHGHLRRLSLSDDNIRHLKHLFYMKEYERQTYKNHQSHLCFIYTKDQILCMEVNHQHRSSQPKHHDWGSHAEVNAIKKFKTISMHEKVSKVGLLVIRFSKTGLFNNSQPCFHCARFIKKHAHFFHTITFTQSSRSLTTLSSQEFVDTNFVHRSQRFRVTNHCCS